MLFCYRILLVSFLYYLLHHILWDYKRLFVTIFLFLRLDLWLLLCYQVLVFLDARVQTFFLIIWVLNWTLLKEIFLFVFWIRDKVLTVKSLLTDVSLFFFGPVLSFFAPSCFSLCPLCFWPQFVPSLLFFLSFCFWLLSKLDVLGTLVSLAVWHIVVDYNVTTTSVFGININTHVFYFILLMITKTQFLI